MKKFLIEYVEVFEYMALISFLRKNYLYMYTISMSFENFG